MKSFVISLCCLTVCLAPQAYAHEGHEHDSQPPTPPWQDASGWPDRIVTTIPETPQSSFAVTWRTDDEVTSSIAQIVEVTDAARFDVGAEIVLGETESLNLVDVPIAKEIWKAEWNDGLAPVNYHSVVFRGLEPDTTYAYRVRGSEGNWSEWFQIQTAPEDGPVKFIYVGDAQNGVLSHWSRLIRAAYAAAPDSRFILHAGDLVNNGARDIEWASWFKAVGFIHGMIPAIPVAGNHEYRRYTRNGEESDSLLSMMWRPQFTLPEEPELPDDLQEAAYDIRYSDDIHIFILSTQNQNLQAQADWLDRELGRSDAKWKIVSMHHPIFSSGSDRDSPDRRKILLPVFEKHAVDLVLQGHDHTYARGMIGQTPERISYTDAGGDIETMFVNSVSGPKQYDFKENGWDDYADTGVQLQRKAENTQFFQIITIEDDTLTYEARTALNNLYDDFIMTKDESGHKTITRGAQSTMDERMFETSEPYIREGID